jgi:hypothetical protein
MERIATANQWVTERWEARAVIPDAQSGQIIRPLFDTVERAQTLHTGLCIELHRDEAQGYYLNLSSPNPSVFVMWRMREREAVPVMVTLSYDEAARLLDAGETVDAIPLPAEIGAWLAAYVAEHYKPEPKKVRKREPAGSDKRK